MGDRSRLGVQAPPSLRGLTGWKQAFVKAHDGTRLYTRFKPGVAPLTAMLCDGIACDGFIWRYLEEDLAELAHIAHWNYRGHGRSAAPVDPDAISIDDLARDLTTVRNAIVDGPAVLFGHSMGCQLVLEGYRDASEGIAGLVLICGAPGRITHTFKGTDALAQTLPQVLEHAQRYPRMTRMLWSNVPPAVATKIALATGEVDATSIEVSDLMAYMEHAANIDPIMFLRMLQGVGERTAEDMLGSVEVPTLVIAGEFDTFTPPHLAEQMAAAIPNAELLMVRGATHVVPVERRKLVRERVATFLHDRVLPHAHGRTA